MRHYSSSALRLSFTCACLLAAVAAQAQQPAAPADPPPDPRTTVTNAGPLIPFLEGTDVFFALGEDTVFEADIMPHLVGFQNFTDVLDIAEQARRDRPKPFAISISGTPAVRLRMFEQVSRPVRTPSYMPRGQVQLIWARNLSPVTQAFVRAAGGPLAEVEQVSLWETHVIVGHHSNGQDGCFWEDEERADGDGECVSVLPIAGERQVNKQDGSFSTNFIRVGMNYRRNYLDRDLWANREWGFRADFEYHPRGWVDSVMVDLYGRARTGVSGTYATRELSWCPKRADATGSVQAIAGHPESVWPVIVTAQFSCYPTRQGGWGVFVRYYGGQDYYNLGLFDNIQRVHVGATFNQSGFFRFRRTETADSRPTP